MHAYVHQNTQACPRPTMRISSMATLWIAARIRARWCCCCSHSKYPVRCVSQSALTPIHTPTLSCIRCLVVSGVANTRVCQRQLNYELGNLYSYIFSLFCFLSTPRHTVTCDTHKYIYIARLAGLCVFESWQSRGMPFASRSFSSLARSTDRRTFPASMHLSQCLATFLVRLVFFRRVT